MISTNRHPNTENQPSSRTKRPTFSSAWLAGCIAAAAMSGPARADLLVHEPFDYDSPTLTGQGGALGTTGMWASNDSTGNKSWALYQEGAPSGVLLSDNFPAGTLNAFDGTVDNLGTSGGFVGYNQGGNNLNAAIGLDPGVTATFTTGTTTWISYVSVRAWDKNEEHPNLVLGTVPAPNGSRGDNYGGIDPGGSGFGTGGGPTRNNRTDIYPMFYNVGQYSNMNGAIPGNAYNQSTFEVSEADSMDWELVDADSKFGAPSIVIMKLQWDAGADDGAGGSYDIISVARFTETETLSEAAFDALITTQPNLSSANWAAANRPSLDQSQLDTITFMGVKNFVDEIRIGTTFADVTAGGPPPELFELTIAEAMQPATGYKLSWESLAGMRYRVLSSPDLGTWTPIPGLEDLPADPPENTENVDPAATTLFYIVEEFPAPPVTLLAEDFEGGALPAGWAAGAYPGFTDRMTLWEVGTPSVVGPIPPGIPLPSGSNCAGTDLDDDYEDPGGGGTTPWTDIYLRTPTLDLSGKTAGTLSFKQWTGIEVFTGSPPDTDYGSIIIWDATDVGGTPLATLEDRSIDGSSLDWTDYSEPLPEEAFTAPAGEIVIEFRFEADDSFGLAGWYIDDVDVTVPGS